MIKLNNNRLEINTRRNKKNKTIINTDNKYGLKVVAPTQEFVIKRYFTNRNTPHNILFHRPEHSHKKKVPHTSKHSSAKKKQIYSATGPRRAQEKILRRGMHTRSSLRSTRNMCSSPNNSKKY